MNKTIRFWTQEEIEYLQEWAGVYPVEKIARNLKRTPESVSKKAQRLSLELKTIYDGWSAHELARLLGVHFSTICIWIQGQELAAKKSGDGINSYYRIMREDFKRFYSLYSQTKTSLKNANQESIKWILEG